MKSITEKSIIEAERARLLVILRVLMMEEPWRSNWLARAALWVAA